jgi:hypothetical protein
MDEVGEPKRAYIAVTYREGRFYIDERDLVTKQYYRLLLSILGVYDRSANSMAQDV